MEYEMKTLAKQIIVVNIEFHSIQIEFLYNSMQNRYQNEYENRLHRLCLLLLLNLIACLRIRLQKAS
jgi:hypothetical protein